MEAPYACDQEQVIDIVCVSLFYVIDTGSIGSRARHHVTCIIILKGFAGQNLYSNLYDI